MTRILCPSLRRTTTGPLAAPPASSVTATPRALCLASVTLRTASVHASQVSLGASVTAVTTLLLRSPPMAVKVGLPCWVDGSPAVCQVPVSQGGQEQGLVAGLGRARGLSRAAGGQLLPGDSVCFPAVNYDSCPRAIEAGIWWPRTRFGLPAAAPCPKGSFGRCWAWPLITGTGCRSRDLSLVSRSWRIHVPQCASAPRVAGTKGTSILNS